MSAIKRFAHLSAPYVEGLAMGELRYQQCADCGAVQILARYACQRCTSEQLDWRVSRGAGSVFAITVVARAPSDEFRALAPYTLVIVDLDEGARVMGHGTPGLVIGDKVHAGRFRHGDKHLVMFHPIDDAMAPSVLSGEIHD